MSAPDSGSVRRPLPNRRAFLGLATGAAVAGVLGAHLTRRGIADVSPFLDPQAREEALGAPLPNVPAEAEVGVVEGRMRASRMLLLGTPWQTPLLIARAEAIGPTVMVLGGVHGDEPGAWMAADDIARWEPRAGTLLVVPRANVLAVTAGQRTLPALGDLNRLYPGTTSTLPMSRMAAAIVAVAREFNAGVLYDMHESWEFFVDRPRNGNAFLGQTVSSGVGPETDTLARSLAARVNPRIKNVRDRMIARSEFSRAMSKSVDSLGLGWFVPGLTPLLVEMGQSRQSVVQRRDLHLLVARQFLELRGML